MSFEHRIYNPAKLVLPRPEIYFDPDGHFLIVVTPWGPRSAAKQAIETILEYTTSSRSDEEITSPFQRLSHLSTTANNLRTAALLANDMIYERENKSEYRLGLELFLASFEGPEVVWVQIGQPHVCLARADQPIMPLSMSLDLSAELGDSKQLLAPLPSQVFGLDPNPNLVINSFRPRPGDQLILLNSAWLPSALYVDHSGERQVDEISKLMHESEPDRPFWVGVWTLAKPA
jgi:hypothetical protein